MNITMIGTGYVGLVTGTLFADRGNKVICVDKNEKIVEQLNGGKIHIFEPGLEALVKTNVANGNLTFTTDLYDSVQNSKIIFIAVGTPSDIDGSFNLKYVKEVAKDIGDALYNTEGFKVIVGKSTVPQGTFQSVISILNEKLKGSNGTWAYVANPETLAEGTAISDFAKPDRVIIGTDSDEAFGLMQELYHPFAFTNNRIIRGSPADAELAKLYSNTALATRVAMINEFARIADITEGADMDIIRQMVCEDQRIGYKFMFPSPGYGGSCFPKDVQGLVARAREHGYNPLLLSQIHPSNEQHKEYLGGRVATLLHQTDATIGVWGLTFKPNTDDMRDAASVPIITHLINQGVKIKAYDPQDVKAREIFGENITFVDNKYAAVEGVDALLLLTEWKEFDAPDFEALAQKMKGKQLFDLRNRWLPTIANKYGFDYYGVGRSYPLRGVGQ